MTTPSSAQVIAVPAKINLYLHVTGKREDGYHTLDSLVAFAPDIVERISLAPAENFSFHMNGPFASALHGEDKEKNLAVRAVRLYGKTTPDAHDRLSLLVEKNIPPGAGLGGGSADAAGAIKAMESLFQKDMPKRDENLLSLGADVPVCYRGTHCRFTGIGDEITQSPALPPLHVLVAWPGKHSSTREVFSKRTGIFSNRTSIPNSFGNSQEFMGFLKTTKNDLRDAAITLIPEISEAEDVIAAQDGCLFARMTGSGSAVFGLFTDPNACTTAQRFLQTNKPQWWVRTSHLV